MTATPGQLIALLNALHLGDVDGLRAKLEEAREGCVRLGQGELAEHLGDAGTALLSGDVRTYRKRIETVVSRLGHLR